MGLRVVVVGGGIAGLAAAYDLCSVDDVEVTVLDAGDRVGGKLRLAAVAGLPIDVGAESVLAVRPEFPDLARDAGLTDLLTAPATTSAGVWSRGRLHRLPTGTLMGVPGDPDAVLGLLTATEVARIRAEPPASPVHADVSVGDVVAERLGPAVVDRLVEPLLGGVYAGQAHLLSVRAAAPALWPAISSGGSLVAAASAAVAAASAAVAAAAAGSHGATRPGGVFTGVVGGVGSVPSLLAARIAARGGQVRPRVIVRELRRRGSAWVVLAGPTTDVEELEADAVVLAVPPAPAGRLLARLAPVASGALAGIATASMAIISLAFDRSALGTVPGSGFLVPPVEGWTTKASTFSSAKWGWLDAAGRDTAYVRASMGRAGQSAVLQQPDEELARIANEEIGRALGRTLPAPLDMHVQRWGGALPQYAVGHLDRVAQIRSAVADLPGLELAGAAYDGVGIPATIGTGRRAAAALLHELTARPVDPNRPPPPRNPS